MEATPRPKGPRPVYDHDCTRCRYLGTVMWHGSPRDLYLCPESGGDYDVVARFGDEGQDYSAATRSEVSREPRAYGALGIAYDLSRNPGV